MGGPSYLLTDEVVLAQQLLSVEACRSTVGLWVSHCSRSFKSVHRHTRSRTAFWPSAPSGACEARSIGTPPAVRSSASRGALAVRRKAGAGTGRSTGLEPT